MRRFIISTWRSLKRSKPLSVLLLLSTVVVLCDGCRTAPISGRKQLLIVPESKEIEMGVTAFKDVLASEPRSINKRFNQLVNRVGHRIAKVAGRPDYQWEFRVIAANQENAFCLPGGKVAFYEGILPICESEAGIAVVMSHEIAHALARHGGERMSHQMASSAVKQAIQFGTRQRAASERQKILQVYGAASKYGVLLPYSRKHESEADRIGLILMAKAGYDPREAPRFWERFAAIQGGPQAGEFFSTHPSDERRASDLRELLPEALQKYRVATPKYGLGEQIFEVPQTAANANASQNQ